MGTGKSFASLATVVPSFIHILVVCPAYLIGNWADEVKKYTFARSFVYTEVNEWEKRGGILILSYDRFVMFKDTQIKKAEALIFDEAHYMSTPSSKRSKRVLAFCKKYQFSKILLLTGTPIRDGADDLLVNLHILSRANRRQYHEDFDNLWKFRKHFMREETLSFWKEGRRIEHTKFVGVRQDRMDEINKILSEFGICEKLTLTTGLKRMYRTVSIPLEVDAMLEEEYLNKSTPTAKRVSAISKIESTAEIVKDILREKECCVVFSDHPIVVETLATLLDKYRCGVITGNTHNHIREDLVKKFQAGKIDVILGTIGAMSTGINLFRSSVVVFNDISYDAANNLQAEARIHRQGQQFDCLSIVVQREGIDSRITQLVTGKEVLLVRTTH
jgi:SNF2 family DNA or RNA helicase